MRGHGTILLPVTRHDPPENMSFGGPVLRDWLGRSLRRVGWRALGGLLCGLVVALPAPALADAAEDLCRAIVAGVIPLVHDAQSYDDVVEDGSALPGTSITGRFISHDLKYTLLSGDMPSDFIIFTGEFLFSHDHGVIYRDKIPFGIMSSSYFRERTWRSTGYETDLARNGTLQMDIKVKNILEVAQFITSNSFSTAYVSGVSSQVDITNQDLSSARISRVMGVEYFVTTRPYVVAANIDVTLQGGRYFVCTKADGEKMESLRN